MILKHDAARIEDKTAKNIPKYASESYLVSENPRKDGCAKKTIPTIVNGIASMSNQ